MLSLFVARVLLTHPAACCDPHAGGGLLHVLGSSPGLYQVGGGKSKVMLGTLRQNHDEC